MSTDNGHPNPNSLDTKDSLNNASLSIDNNNFNASNNQVHDLVEKLQQLELQKGCICMPEDDFKVVKFHIIVFLGFNLYVIVIYY